VEERVFSGVRGTTDEIVTVLFGERTFSHRTFGKNQLEIALGLHFIFMEGTGAGGVSVIKVVAKGMLLDSGCDV